MIASVRTLLRLFLVIIIEMQSLEAGAFTPAWTTSYPADIGTQTYLRPTEACAASGIAAKYKVFELRISEDGVIRIHSDQASTASSLSTKALSTRRIRWPTACRATTMPARIRTSRN